MSIAIDSSSLELEKGTVNDDGKGAATPPLAIKYKHWDVEGIGIFAYNEG